MRSHLKHPKTKFIEFYWFKLTGQFLNQYCAVVIVPGKNEESESVETNEQVYEF